MDEMTGTPMDAQEVAEREEAASAYAGENPQHFVNFCEDCISESDDATKEIRKTWDECWKAREQDIDFSEKEEWQSKIVTNKPFVIAQQAKGIIRKALTDKPDYFDVANVSEEDVPESEFWKKALAFWGSEQKADIPKVFARSAEMSFVVGQSMEMIPQWDSDGLKIATIEPWKIKRDPDAEPENPWSGNYWIHEEWIDKWVLLQQQKEGIYSNVDKVEDDTDSEKGEQEKRKNMIWSRSKYRKSVSVKEFWGTVISPKGEMLLPSATYTIAGRTIIKPPMPSPYISMKWPGVSFSPIPHPLRFNGDGLIKGVRVLWLVLNNLLNLHMDNLNWVINKPKVLDLDKLQDPTDTGIFPGKILLARNTAGQYVLAEVETNAETSNILAEYNHIDTQIQNGSFVNDFVQGLPGNRSDITLGEVELKTSQSMGIFDSIAKDVEGGMVNLLWACYETIALNWTATHTPSPTAVFPTDPYAQLFNSMEIAIRRQLLKLNSNIKVTAISSLARKLDFLKRLETFMERAGAPPYIAYTKPYQILKAYRDSLSLSNYNVIVNDQEAQVIDQMAATQPQPEGEPNVAG